MGLQMIVERLLKEELQYELRVRGLPSAGLVKDLRVALRKTFRQEAEGEIFICHIYPFTYDEDSAAILQGREKLNKLLDAYEISPVKETSLSIETKLSHLINRVNNSKPVSPEDVADKAENNLNLATMTSRYQLLLNKSPSYKLLSAAEDETEEASKNLTSSNINNGATLNPPTNIVIKSTPVSKWCLKFSGEPRSISVNAFIERVQELVIARNVTLEQLFAESIDLFSGKALVWYRAYKHQYKDWSEVESALRREFQPVDYDDRLLEEIKRRTMGPDENMSIYLAIMQTMFSRLSEPLSEAQKLKIVLRNLKPFYQNQLGLTVVKSFEELLIHGRTLETRKLAVENYVPPSRKKTDLETDLAYLSIETETQLDIATIGPRIDNSNSTTNLPSSRPPLQCWHCRKTDHLAAECREPKSRFICYRCGKPDATTRNCPRCNSQSRPLRPEKPKWKTMDGRVVSSCTFSNSTRFVQNLMDKRKIQLNKNKVVLDYILENSDKDKRPHVTVNILDSEILALLDSGASRTILGRDGWNLLAQSGWKLRARNRPMCTVANGKTVASSGIVTLPITLKDRTVTLDVLVVNDVKHKLILGIDFWESIGIIPDLCKGQWSFSDPDLATFETQESNFLQSNIDLTAEQRKQIEEVIDNHFENDNTKLGRTNLVKHVIKTSSPPIKQRYYPVSVPMQGHIDKELDAMLKLGVIERSKSAWSSPILLIKKKDSTYRFCVDFRKVNKVTEKDAYPLPYVSAILDRLRGAKFITSLDVKTAYWQIPMDEESKQYTAFTIPGRGLFQFTRMPFGLHNAPATWQRLIDQVLGPDLEPYVFVYLDDIIIFADTFEKHLEILTEVMRRLRNAGLALSRDKCHFCQPELKYLGYVVNSQGLLADPEKVTAILNIPTPKNSKEIRRIVGMASWYRRFIPNFSSIISPLTALLRKNCKFVWSDVCETAFTTIKNCLVSAPILACPDFSLPFTIQTDASGFGIGCVLTQTVNGEERVICYISRSLTRAERNFSVTERECLAVLWAVEKLRPYLEGSRFTVITDHHSLVWLNNLKDPSGRLARWAVRLQQYDFEIIHRKGKEHLVPDALSRAVPEIDTISVSPVEDTKYLSKSHLNSESCEQNLETSSVEKVDRWYKQMMGRVTSQPFKYRSWRITTGKLYKSFKSKYPSLNDEIDEWREVVPKSDRKQLISDCHDKPTSGHLGIFKTFERLAQHYYWPKMKADVARYVNKCSVCMAHKPEQKKPAGLMSRHPEVTKPWQMISVDIVGPLPRSTKGYSYILSVVDCFTKFVMFFPLRSATAAQVIQKLEENVLLIFGAPQYLLTDNGVQFRSKEFKHLATSYKIQILFNAYYHAQANPVERTHRVLKTMLASYVKDNHRTWDRFLPKVACAVRTAVHEVIGMTPYFANFGREMTLEGTQYPNTVNSETLENVQFADRHDLVKRAPAMLDVYDDIVKRLKSAYEKSKIVYDLRRRPATFAVGDTVWRRNYVLSDASKHFNAKLAPKFVGPFIIHRKVSYATYELSNESGVVRGIWHAKDLKPSPE